MCGRFTVKVTWVEMVVLYRLTLDRPPHNLQPRYNVCPTDPIDVVTEHERDFVRMRWGLVPRWWPKPLKELRAATFNVRAETAVLLLHPHRWRTNDVRLLVGTSGRTAPAARR